MLDYTVMIQHKNYEFWVPIVVIAIVVVAAVIGVSVAMQPLPDTAEAKCDAPGSWHEMRVGKDSVMPSRIDGKQCDMLRIVNNTGSQRTIMFGHADAMEAYDGIHEKTLKDGESFSVRLFEKGEFHFHEHESDLVGNFTVR